MFPSPPPLSPSRRLFLAKSVFSGSRCSVPCPGHSAVACPRPSCQLARAMRSERKKRREEQRKKKEEKIATGTIRPAIPSPTELAAWKEAFPARYVKDYIPPSSFSPAPPVSTSTALTSPVGCMHNHIAHTLQCNCPAGKDSSTKLALDRCRANGPGAGRTRQFRALCSIR